MRTHRGATLGYGCIKRGLVTLVLVAGFCSPVESYAQGEHARRIGAELTVLLGDLRMLVSSAVSEQHARGLRQRILGGLTTLDILTRLADQEIDRPGESRFNQINALRTDLVAERYSVLQGAITDLLIDYPLELPDIATPDPVEFAALHRQLCAACHDNPALAVERPAYNLAKQSAAITDGEMFARLLVGVRGDRVTGIDNPLTDRQIMGLLEYYKTP